MARRNRREGKANPGPKAAVKNNRVANKDLKRTDFCETPLTHRGAGRLRAQLRGVTVERCSLWGIWAQVSGSVELTGCSLRGNGRDYDGKGQRDYCDKGTITADGRRVG